MGLLNVEPAPVRHISYGRAWATITLLCAIWGSTWLVIRQGLEDLPPFRSAAIRFSLAAVLFALIADRLARREGGEKPPPQMTLVMGLFVFAIPYAIVYWGETTLPSGLASVLWSVFPICVAACGHFFLTSERLEYRQWCGLLIGFMSVASLFAVDLRQLGADGVRVGLVFLLSPLVSAFGNLYIKRFGTSVSSAYLNRNGLLVGAMLLWLPALAEWDQPASWTPRALFSVSYLVVVGTVIPFAIYFWLLRTVPATWLSLIAYVVPALGVAAGSNDCP